MTRLRNREILRMKQMKQRGLKLRTEVTLKKIYCFFIRKEGENDDTPTYAMTTLSVMFILSGKAWSIQAIKCCYSDPKFYLIIDGYLALLPYLING